MTAVACMAIYLLIPTMQGRAKRVGYSPTRQALLAPQARSVVGGALMLGEGRMELRVGWILLILRTGCKAGSLAALCGVRLGPKSSDTDGGSPQMQSHPTLSAIPIVRDVAYLQSQWFSAVAYLQSQLLGL